MKTALIFAVLLGSGMTHATLPVSCQVGGGTICIEFHGNSYIGQEDELKDKCTYEGGGLFLNGPCTEVGRSGRCHVEEDKGTYSSVSFYPPFSSKYAENYCKSDGGRMEFPSFKSK